MPGISVTGTGRNITGPDSNQRNIWFAINLHWRLLIVNVKFWCIKILEQFYVQPFALWTVKLSLGKVN